MPRMFRTSRYLRLDEFTREPVYTPLWIRLDLVESVEPDVWMGPGTVPMACVTYVSGRTVYVTASADDIIAAMELQ